MDCYEHMRESLGRERTLSFRFRQFEQATTVRRRCILAGDIDGSSARGGGFRNDIIPSPDGSLRFIG
jgi:hypothetical protein